MGVVLLEVSDSVQEAYEEALRAIEAVARKYPCPERVGQVMRETILINGMRENIETLAMLLVAVGCRSMSMYQGLMDAHTRLCDEAEKLKATVKKEGGLDV